MPNDKSISVQIIEEYLQDPERKFDPAPSDDPLINLFISYMVYNECSDRLRLQHDGDARYYNSILGDPQEAMKADTITSFYTPYKEMLHRATGHLHHKYLNPFDKLIARRNDKGYKDVNDKFAEFAELYQTAGNYMLLPSRAMNSERYKHSEDKIDKSLYECFPGGELAHFFGNNGEEIMNNLAKWVREQKLEMMFEGGEIKRNKIIPFNKENPYVTYKNMTNAELDEFIANAVDLIKRRNALIG